MSQFGLCKRLNEQKQLLLLFYTLILTLDQISEVGEENIDQPKQVLHHLNRGKQGWITVGMKKMGFL